MFQIPRFLTPVLAAAVVAGMTCAAQAQFFPFFDRQPPRKAERKIERKTERPVPPRPIEPMPVGEKASFNDTARFLAGVALPEDSPLARYTRDPSWQAHARSFDHSWRELEGRRLSRIRAWSAQNLKGKAPLYYMFSGPDLLYADAFFPNASTYILAGLEPVGHIPQISPRVISSLGSLRSSMGSSISLSFFITKNMKSQLRETVLSGTLPILMVYAARAGKTITDISLISLDSDGQVTPVTPGQPQRGVQGVKMVFGGQGKPEQTLYYFSTDISDGGLKASGFLKFLESFGPGDAMFKAASYLPHSGGFAQIRDFVLSKANNIVQDDSGIPIHSFKRDQWIFHPYGRYLGPIGIFPGRHQVQLDEIFRKGPVKPLEFGMGYRWRPNESNMIWAERKEPAAPVAAPAVLRPSISEPAPQAAPAAAPAPQPQQEAKPVEAAPAPAPVPAAAPAAPPQPEAKPDEIRSAVEPASPADPAAPAPAQPMAPAAAQPVVPPAGAAEQSAASSEPVRR